MGIIGENVGAGLESGAIGESDLGEFGGDFLDYALILGAMSDDDVKALGRVLTDGSTGVNRLTHAFADRQLNSTLGVRLDFFHGFIHRLGPSHIIDGAGQDKGDFDFVRLGFRRFGFGRSRLAVAAATGQQQRSSQ